MAIEGLNRVQLLGNLGGEPEIKFVRGGNGQPTALMILRIATNDSYVDDKDFRRPRTEWHRVQVWGRRAEGLARCLETGDHLYVEGQLRTRSYDSNGIRQTRTDIIAQKVMLVTIRAPKGQAPAGSRFGGPRTHPTHHKSGAAAEATTTEPEEPAAPPLPEVEEEQLPPPQDEGTGFEEFEE